MVAHLDALRRYARILTRNGPEADDLVQGALLRALERQEGFRDGSDLRVWLMSILHNHHIDRLRSDGAATARDAAWADLEPGFAPPAGEHAARLDRVRRAVLALPRDQREALHLLAVEGRVGGRGRDDPFGSRGHGHVARRPRPRRAARLGRGRHGPACPYPACRRQ